MKRVLTVLATIGLLANLSVVAIAEDIIGSQEPEITVIVSAERTSQPVAESIASATVVTAKDIRERNAQTVADAVQMVPGLSIRRAGSVGAAATTYVRGAKANQMLVLVDGERLSSAAMFGGTDLSKLPVEDVSRIEVIRGPVSSLYGSDAIGGVINIITKKPTTGGGDVNVGFGSHGRIDRSINLRGVGNWGWQVFGSAPAFNGIRPNSDFSATNLSGRLNLPVLAGWDVAVHAETYHDKLGLPNADSDHTGYFDPDDRQWWDRDNVDVSAKRSFGESSLEWRAYGIRQALHNSAPGLDWLGNSIVYDSRISGKTRVGEFTYRVPAGKHSLVAGSEYREEDYRDLEQGPSPSFQKNSITNRALYVQDRWILCKDMDAVAGVRYENHSTAGSRLTPRLGVTKLVSAGTRMRVSYAEGFRAPNFVELYYPVGPWGPGFSGNPNLRPEKSAQYEVGLNVEKGWSTLDVAIFTAHVGDLIQASSATPYANVGRAMRRGIEVSWDYKLNQSDRLNLAYANIEAKNRDTGGRIFGIPHNQLSLSLSRSSRVFNTTLTGRWNSDKPDMAFDPVTFASRRDDVTGKAVFDLNISRKAIGVFSPYLIIRNLTNTTYEETSGFLAEGFSIFLGTRAGW